MSLEKTFASLFGQLQELDDSLKNLNRTLVEDKPAAVDSAVVDHFLEVAGDLLGATQAALIAARGAVKAAGYPLDLELARHQLSAIHNHALRISSSYGDIAAYERIEAVVHLADKGGQWLAWVTAAIEGLAACRPPLENVQQAIALCWEEVGERNPASSVSVQVTHVGQKIEHNEKTDE
jgi:hypothetical protein